MSWSGSTTYSLGSSSNNYDAEVEDVRAEAPRGVLDNETFFEPYADKPILFVADQEWIEKLRGGKKKRGRTATIICKTFK